MKQQTRFALLLILILIASLSSVSASVCAANETEATSADADTLGSYRSWVRELLTEKADLKLVVALQDSAVETLRWDLGNLKLELKYTKTAWYDDWTIGFISGAAFAALVGKFLYFLAGGG